MDFQTALADIRKARKVRKDSPGAGDVHVASTGWAGRPPRRIKHGPDAVTAKADLQPGNGHFMRQLSLARANSTSADRSDDMPTPLYVHRPLANAKELHAWAVGAGIKNPVPPEEMHTTVVYSRAPASMKPETNPLTVTGGDRAVQALGDKGAVVLIFDSPELTAQHQDAQVAGATHDFPSFIPHVTLSYDAGDTDLSKIEAPGFPLEFGAEVHAPLNDNWAEEKGLRKFELKVPVSRTSVFKIEGEPDKNLVFGWASIVEKDGQTVIDVQDDAISEADLEEAFYGFVKDARNAGEMHADFGAHIGTCVECMVFTKEKQKIMKIDLGFVGAWIGFEVTPEVFSKVRDGTYPAFSIGGEGIRVRDA